MFKKSKVEPTKLEKTLDALLDQMSTMDPASEEYSKIADQVAKLYKLKETDSSKSIDPNTVLTVAGSLLGIVAILGFEKANVVTSKALSFVLKLR